MKIIANRGGLTIAWALFVPLLLVATLGTRVLAQEEKQSGRIVLDIPVSRLAPEDSKEHVTIVVRGMMKSRSGAT